MMDSIPLLTSYVEERTRLLDDIRALLESDPQVKAAWLWGSFGRGEEDALSDIDLWVVVDDPLIEKVQAQPRLYASQVRDPILFLEAPQNAPEGGAYLMACYDAPTAPHIVDWYWQPLSRAFIPPQVRLLFDHAGLPHRNEPIRFQGGPARQEIVERPSQFISFFWMMLMIAAKTLCRSPQAEEFTLLPYIIESLKKTYHLLGREPEGFFENSRHLSPDGKVRLLFDLAGRMSEMTSILSARGESVPASIIPGAFRYIQFVRSIIEETEG